MITQPITKSSTGNPMYHYLQSGVFATISMSKIVRDMNKARPFLKWVGGKGRVIPQLEKFFPETYNNFYEPFVGGGAVFFDLNIKKATINDINANLIGLYINIRDNLEPLIGLLTDLQSQYHDLDETAQKDLFYQLRDEYNSIKDTTSLRKSSLLVFLNKTCFNGMYRENQSGEYNVPFGKHRKPTICDDTNLRYVSKTLQNTSILSGSYINAVKDAKNGDFIYLDPPYYPLNSTSSFTSYSEGDFVEQDQVNLKELVDDLTKRGCKVMVSNSYVPFIRNLYKDYRQEVIHVGRAINAVGSGRGKIKEIVILNY